MRPIDQWLFQIHFMALLLRTILEDPPFVSEFASVSIFEMYVWYCLSYFKCLSGLFLDGGCFGKMGILCNWAAGTLYSFPLAKQECLANTWLFPPLWQEFWFWFLHLEWVAKKWTKNRCLRADKDSPERGSQCWWKALSPVSQGQWPGPSCRELLCPSWAPCNTCTLLKTTWVPGSFSWSGDSPKAQRLGWGPASLYTLVRPC